MMNAITKVTSVAVLVTLGLTLAAQAAESLSSTVVTPVSQPANFRGDRNGYYANCDPPITWNDLTGENIAWRTRMPNWCLGLPIVVGERVFAMSEPGWKSDFPELVCLDVRSGKVLWQKEINHLSLAIPDETKRKEIGAAWHNYLERFRGMFRLFYEVKNAKDDATAAIPDPLQEDGGDAAPSPPHGNGPRASTKKALTDKAKAMGWMKPDQGGYFADGYRGGGYGVLRSVGGPGLAPEYKQYERELATYGLRLETFYRFGITREGECFSTPVSDGKFVYVVTDQGTHACFDLEGNLKWMNWIEPHFNTGGHDDTICRSPLLCDGLFITDLHLGGSGATDTSYQPVIALDTATGETVWRARPEPLPFSRMTVTSSQVMDVDGQRLYIDFIGYVLRVKDGKFLLTICPELTNPNNGVLGTDDRTDTVFYWDAIAKEIVAVKLAFGRDGILTQEESWRAKVPTSNSAIVHDGKIYTGFDTIDIGTGRVTPWVNRANGSPTRWLLALAGGRIYSLREGGGWSATTATSDVFDLSGKRLASNILMMPPTATREMRDQRIETTGRALLPGEFNSECGWGFSYSCSFTIAGDGLYVRSNDELICIRKGGGAGPRQMQILDSENKESKATP
jgi:outer membrane protein assembly factor BamB